MHYKKIALFFFGCRTNQQEIESIRFLLINNGGTIVAQPQDADLVIVNTCAVTAQAQSECIALIRKINSLYPLVSICVTGCLAQLDVSSLKQFPSVHWIIDNRHKDDIVNILNQCVSYTVVHDTSPEQTRPNVSLASSYLEYAGPILQKRTRFFLKIQEGCNFRCSYCIVPSLRGPSSSVSPLILLDTCKKAILSGFKEIVLVGTHIGQYRAEKDYTLLHLIHDILSIGNSFRVRLSSLDPRDCLRDLFELIKNHDQMCKHIHVSLQHTDMQMLSSMNRGCDSLQRLYELLYDVRIHVPYVGIGADIIVGFPGETDQIFEQMLHETDALSLNYIHVFRYSKRIGTSAAAFPCQLSEKIKKERSDRIRLKVKELRKEFIQRLIDTQTPLTALVEQAEPVKALTTNYIAVHIEQANIELNTLHSVVLTSYDMDHNRCRAQIYRGAAHE